MDLHAKSFPFNLSELGDSTIQLGGKISLEEVMQSIFETVISRLRIGDTTTWGVTIATVMITSMVIYTLLMPSNETIVATESKEEEEPIVLRDFTLEQLREFDGTDGKKIYISLKYDVYDVTKAGHMYGPDASYSCFAGREASCAMAKMSFEEVDLSNHKHDDLTPFEKSTLNDWIDKFKYYKSYPVVGRVSIPPSNLQLTADELAECKGYGTIPTGRVDAPIYTSLCGDVFDVSYGGKEMYAKDCAYHLFAGIDSSRALAKMSFKAEDIQCGTITDLTESEQKILRDWYNKFATSKKYPIVGKLV
jgi:membrane-associated progesterone receptor component